MTLRPMRQTEARPIPAGAVDVHAHVLVPEVYEQTRSHSLFTLMAEDPAASGEMRAQLRARSADVERRMADVTERIARMDEMGVSLQVLTASLVHQCSYFAAPERSLALERTSNDRIAAMVAARPDRFLGLGGVPLHAPELAAEELERCVTELGLSGVQISTRAGEMEIGDRRLRPFWARAEALGAVVFVHPAGNPDARLRPWQLWNSLGQAMEEAFAIASLIYEGILESYPALKICISHGGGYMPYYTGRVERNYVEKPATRVHMRRPPADYLRMLYYDSCVYDAKTLAVLIDKVGADRVLLGSDYPVGEPRPVDFVRSTPGLSAAEQEMILRGNALRLFGLAERWEA
ncbi:MAG: amidohydrolase family protein [Rhodovarius sp.]|nr:amidohydrolase family protein [Rhodovarius sp.]